jgi:hypothetical protein
LFETNEEIRVESEPITDERVRTLIDDELKSFDVKPGDSMKKIEDLNAEFIKNHPNSLAHRAEAAKIILLLNPTNNLQAIEFLTTLDSNFTDQNLKLCSTIYENMQSGDYGSIDFSILEKYRLQCSQLWPQANIFQLNPISTFDRSQSVAYSYSDNLTDGGAVSLNQN